MNKGTTGYLLIGLALFMLLGFTRAHVQGMAAIMTFLIAVVLPAAGGGYLLFANANQNKQIAANKTRLGQKTLEAEIIKLARRAQGRLTVVEVMSELGVDKDQAEQALDSLAQQKYADYEITDSGLLVYTFAELQLLDEKNRSRSIEDA